MKTPVETLLDGVAWTETGNKPVEGSELPYATHSGVFKIDGFEFRCHRLNTGQAIFEADDVRRFFDGAFGTAFPTATR